MDARRRGRGRRLRRISFAGSGCAALACALLAAGCRAPLPAPPPAATPPAAPAGVVLYAVDSAASRLALRVYRDGPLARFGHNHVIVTRELRGTIQWPPDPARASLLLRFPAASLRVDEPAERAAAGADFAAPVDEEARSGTRGNLLGPRVLDAAHYPDVTLVSERIEGTAAEPRIALRAYVAGHDALLEVPVRLTREAGTLRATGRLELRQTALGLVPFSLMLGALRVADTISVDFDIVARPLAAGAANAGP